MAAEILSRLGGTCKDTFIYGLMDPTTAQVRYIGKTCYSLRRRLSGHIGAARASKKPRHVLCWIKSLLAEGMYPEIFLIETVQFGENWEEAEGFWIAYMRSLGADLCNLTSGGEGAPGRKPSVQERMAKSVRRGKDHPLYGRPKPPHVHASMRKALEKCRSDKEWVAWALERRMSGITREQILKSTDRLLSYKNDQALRALRESRRINAMQSDDFKQKISKISRDRWSSRRSEIIEAQNAGKGPEWRKRQSEARKALWKNPNGPYAGLFLSADKREEIRLLIRGGMTGKAVALMFGISQSRVSQIKNELVES